jgi:pSer/pThr/pTyr-binding forkhead associated (FHA) protein
VTWSGGDGIGDLGGTRSSGPRRPRAERHPQIAEAGRAPRLVPVEHRPATIGRGTDCDVVWPTRASRHHARLDVRGGVIVLTDLGSTNGTRVNGRRVREVVLGVGDRIEVGQTLLRVLEGDAASGAVAPSHQTPDA